MLLAEVAPTISIAIAVIGLVGSISSVIITALLSRRLEQFKQESQRVNNERIEKLRAELADAGTRHKARLDYEYEALKRLYSSVEPLVFQLIESSSRSMHRVLSLQRSADEGALFGKGSWMASDGYYLRSTVYHFMAPLAVFRLVQRKLTAVDLTLEPWLGVLYRLTERAYFGFTDDFRMAKGFGDSDNLVYKPNEAGWRVERERDPKVYWRQGFPIGVLDQIIDAMAVQEGDAYRIVSFGEFDEKITKTKAYELAVDVFMGFDPRNRPVLWRILLAQYYLLGTLQIAASCRNNLDLIPAKFADFLHTGITDGAKDRRAEQKRDLSSASSKWGDPANAAVAKRYVQSSVEEVLDSAGIQGITSAATRIDADVSKGFDVQTT